MGEGMLAARASARRELQQYNRSRVIVILAVLEAITFLVLVSLFGLTGSKAPTALVNLDGGEIAANFVEHLEAAHHSFALRPMNETQAKQQLDAGNVVAVITIPPDFSNDIQQGRTTALPVTVDNVDTDLTDDIKEAVPSTITSFGRDMKFPGVRLVANEKDVYKRDTGYVPYLVVSALALDALVVCGILGAMAITHEYEGGTMVQWRLAPVSPAWILAGKIAAAMLVGAVAVAAAALIVIFGYGIPPDHIALVLLALGLAVVVFTSLGAAIGALLKRTLPVAALFFGLALPFYLDSGAIEPTRYDGETLYILAHFSPVYSVVSVLQNGFHDLRVQPENLQESIVMLVVWTVAAVLVATAVLQRRFAKS